MSEERQPKPKSQADIVPPRPPQGPAIATSFGDPDDNPDKRCGKIVRIVLPPKASGLTITDLSRTKILWMISPSQRASMMRAIGLLALLMGFLDQAIADGQVFTHAMIGVFCGIMAALCGWNSAQLDRSNRWVGKAMVFLGLLLSVWCASMAPSTYTRQRRFNLIDREVRERKIAAELEKQLTRP